MITSYKSLFPASAPAPVESFRYPETQAADGAPSGGAPLTGEEDEIAQLLLRAHAEGVREGEELERERARQEIQKERVRVEEAILKFQTEVSEYFSRVESEVVQLAVAIAEKILRREVQTDPLLVTKMTKDILNNLHQQTQITVRVHPDQAEMWRLERRPHDDKVKLEIVPDPSVSAGNCVLQTELGATEIGIAVQLQEIESGLLDLLAQTPDQK